MEEDGGLSPKDFVALLRECREQPSWREMADRAADYYDDNQIDQDTLQAIKRKGMGPIVRNVIKPLVNVILGMEAKTRSDWKVVPEDDRWTEVAEALSAKIHEAERETRADRACSDAYASQIKVGIGWVEVSRNSDPFGFPYKVNYVHRREIWWDWRDDTPDLSKSRFLIRKRWFDVDQAIAYFPDHAEVLSASVSGDPNRYELESTSHALKLGFSHDQVRDVSLEDYEEWRNTERKRVCLYEVWYKQFTKGFVISVPGGAAVEFNPQNLFHVGLVKSGVPLREMVFQRMRMAIFAGPHRLSDCLCSDRHFPYVPFWGYREDRTGVPYGVVRAMMSPQDEINARLQKMMWLLSAKRVIMDSDALDKEYQNVQDMLAELARPDAVVILDPARANRDAIHIDDNLTLADAQFKVLQDAMAATQQVVGVFNAMLGRESSTTSGIAINSLVEQGSTALAEINDNYRYARRLVGERLLNLIRQDLLGVQAQATVEVSGRKKRIALNVPTPDGIVNDVSMAAVKVVLDDVPSTSSFRQQQFVALAEVVKSLPPNLQVAMAPFVIEASDIPRRKEIADTLRRAMGQQIPSSPEEEAALAQAQAAEAQFASEVQKKQIFLDLAEREARISKMRAEAERAMREARESPDDSIRQEYERRFREIENQAKARIDAASTEIVNLRIQAAKREQDLLARLADVTSKLNAQIGNREAELRKAQVEKEIAEINAEKEKEIARINSESQKVVDGVVEEIAKLREEMNTRMEAVRAEKKEPEKKEEEKPLHLNVNVGGAEQEIVITMPDGKVLRGVKRTKEKT